MQSWPRLGRLHILPPSSRFNRGKPNDHSRNKSPHESSSNPHKLSRHGWLPTCSNYRKKDHNKTRCPNPAAAPPPKRLRGRAQKEHVWNDLLDFFWMALFTDIWCLFNVRRVFKLAVRSYSRIITNSTSSIITRRITRRVWVLYITKCICVLHVYAMLMFFSYLVCKDVVWLVVLNFLGFVFWCKILSLGYVWMGNYFCKLKPQSKIKFMKNF